MPLATRSTAAQATPRRSEASGDAFSTPASEANGVDVRADEDATGWQAAQLEPLSGKTRSITKARVTFSPHFRHHPYNPDLRVSTSLKPLLYQQLRAQPASPLPPREGAVLQPMSATPQHDGGGPPSSSPLALAHGSAQAPRSILRKKEGSVIRLAPSVESGTQRNREEARTAVGHTRRRSLVRMDTFQLARRGAGGEEAQGQGNGQGRIVRGEPVQTEGATRHAGGHTGTEATRTAERGQDEDHNAEAGPSTRPACAAEGSSVDSLLDVVVASHCSTAEDYDLFAIEDAYSMLMTRFRGLFSTKAAAEGEARATDSLPAAIAAFQARVPGIILAFRRDVGNLVGRKPADVVCPINDDSSSPMGSPAQLPGTSAPRPLSPPRSSASPQSDDARGQPRKRGYTAAEVRHRRAMAGVGQEALKFLALVFYRTELFSLFTDADLTSLLATVLSIPNTLKLYTPNPKKSYAFAVYALANIQLPADCVRPLKKEIQRALSNAVGDVALHHWGGGPGKAEGGGGNVKARTEGFAAIRQLMTFYAEDFALELTPFLEAILKGICDPPQGTPQTTRVSATRALLACLQARMDWQDTVVSQLEGIKRRLDTVDGEDEDTALKEEQRFLIKRFEDIRKAVQESSNKVAQLLKAKPPRHHGSPTPPSARSLWAKLLRVLDGAMEAAPEWACATWAALVTLMGEAYMLPEFWKEINQIVLRPIQDYDQDGHHRRIPLCCQAWRHAVHASLLCEAKYDLASGLPVLQTAVRALLRTRQLEMAAVLPRAALGALGIPDLAKAPENVDSSIDTQEWIEHCFNGLATVLDSYSGAMLQAAPPLDEAGAAEKQKAYDLIFDKAILPSLREGLAPSGCPAVQRKSWAILAAVTRKHDAQPWKATDALSSALMRYTGLKTWSRKIDDEAAPVRGWAGDAWVASRFGALLDLFRTGLKGLPTVTKAQDSDAQPVIPVHLLQVWQNLLRAAGYLVPDEQACKQAMRCLADFLSNFIDGQARIPAANAPKQDHSNQSLAIVEGLLKTLLESPIAAHVDTVAFAVIPQQEQNRRDARSPSAEGMEQDRPTLLTLPGYLLQRHQAVLLANPDLANQSGTFRLLLELAGTNQQTLGKVMRDMDDIAETHGSSNTWDVLWRQLCAFWCQATFNFGNNGSLGAAADLLAMSFRARPDDPSIGVVWLQIVERAAGLASPDAVTAVLDTFASKLASRDIEPTMSRLRTISTLLAMPSVATQCASAFLSWLTDFLQPVVVFESDSALCNAAVVLLLSILANAASAEEAAAVGVLHQILPTINALLHPSTGGADSVIVDKLYIRVLDSIAGCMRNGSIAIDSASLTMYSDTFASRVASTTDEQVLDAFQAFWNSTFGTVANLEYDDRLKDLLRDFLRTDSQYLVVPGLQLESQTEEVAQSGYEADVSRMGNVATADVDMSDRPAEAEAPVNEPAEVEAALRSDMQTEDADRDDVFSTAPKPEPPLVAVTRQRRSDAKKSAAEVVPDSQSQPLRETPTRSLRKAASGTLAVVGKAVGRMLGSWTSPTVATFAEVEQEPPVVGQDRQTSPAAGTMPLEHEVEDTDVEDRTSSGRKRRQKVSVEILVPSKRRRSRRQSEESEIVAESLPIAPVSPPHTRQRTMAKKASSRLEARAVSKTASEPSLSTVSPAQEQGRTAEQERLLALVQEAAALAEHAKDLDMVAISDILDGLERIRNPVMHGLRAHANADALRRSSSLGDM